MNTFGETLEKLKKKIKATAVYAFGGAVILGLIAHMVVMTGDYPNHDGLGSLYFDQNMIASGRWFLGTACGISSYFALPWLIGVLSLIYIGLAAGFTVCILKIKTKTAAVVIGGIMAAFPVLASTFAYVFTMDGYMLGLLFAVLSVFVTAKYKFGWAVGAIILALSMGCYQAYLPVAVILCICAAVIGLTETGSAKEKLFYILRFAYMGILGGALYYIVLKILLKVQGVTIGSYQGGDALAGGIGGGAADEVASSGASLAGKIINGYKDFIKFSVKSKVLAPNVFAWIAIAALCIVAAVLIIKEIIKNKWYKHLALYIVIIAVIVLFPVAENLILILMGDVNYHAIMRYGFVCIPIIIVAIADNYGGKLTSWIIPICGAVLILCYIVTDNIGYSNLQKKYERTYAYCERLLDRIEQTEGYYQGIPIALIGVVSDDEYPKADLTEGITDNLIGLSGDYLVYKAEDYHAFIKAYLGADLNIITAGEKMVEIYNSPEYVEMNSFPCEDSVKLVDEIIYVKTENIDYGLREK